VENIGRAFVDCSLPKLDWTHAAHFAAVLWLLRERSDLDVSAELPGLIRAYNESTGVPNTDTDGYHATITLASIRAARSVLTKHGDVAPLHAVANALLASDLGRSDWLLAYWSRSRLFSVEARRRWIDPDLMMLPF
jgi:hypothetical protein